MQIPKWNTEIHKYLKDHFHESTEIKRTISTLIKDKCLPKYRFEQNTDEKQNKNV